MAISGIGAGAGFGTQGLNQLQGIQSGAAGQAGNAATTRAGSGQAPQPGEAQGFSIQGPSSTGAPLIQNAVQETRSDNSRASATEPRAGDVPPPPAGSGRGQTLDISA